MSELVNGSFTPCRHLGHLQGETIVFSLIQSVDDYTEDGKNILGKNRMSDKQDRCRPTTQKKASFV